MLVKKMTSEELEKIPGVGPLTAKRLKDAGFDSIDAVAVSSPDEIIRYGGISEDTAKKIILLARQHAGLNEFEINDGLLQQRKIHSNSKVDSSSQTKNKSYINRNINIKPFIGASKDQIKEMLYKQYLFTRNEKRSNTLYIEDVIITMIQSNPRKKKYKIKEITSAEKYEDEQYGFNSLS